MNRFNYLRRNIIDFGYYWLWLIVPSFLSFLISGPLSMIPGFFKFSYEFGIVTSNLALSISAAAIFYFAIEFLPRQKRKFESNNLMNENIKFLDQIFLQHINNIDPNIRFSSLKCFYEEDRKKLTFLFLKINLFKTDYMINIPGSKFPSEDSYVELLISSTNRTVDLKNIILFAPDFYSIKSFEYINRVLWFQEMLEKHKEKNFFTKQLAFELVIYYLKFKSEIHNKNENHQTLNN